MVRRDQVTQETIARSRWFRGQLDVIDVRLRDSLDRLEAYIQEQYREPEAGGGRRAR